MKKTIVMLLILSFVGTTLLMGMMPEGVETGKGCCRKTEKCEYAKKECPEKVECKKSSEEGEKAKKWEDKKQCCIKKCQHEKKVEKSTDKST